MDKTKRDQQHLDDATPGERTARFLSCELTADEQRERGVQMGNAFDEIKRLKAEAKGIADEYKAKIAGAEQQHDTLKSAVQQRREYREVDCTEWHDFKKGKVYIVRDDLGTIAESRQMTPSERQRLIPGMEVLPGVTLQSVKDADAQPGRVGHAYQIPDDNSDLCKACGFPKRDAAHSTKNRGVALDENGKAQAATATA